ncbi:4-hydroxybenzoate octaprenyltransferase [Maridesulfovibrio ferrireducens]|uniref:4-hydroxybenzoate octaprenyltransferase n=1 Tax=Maridesulfovibrio ferrireducens TaxID=246191 RepID=UPI0026F11EE0|nr:4-hydroxybenzoate octaprenyltransferase [Maridesulfovibrio ferrireducens]
MIDLLRDTLKLLWVNTVIVCRMIKIEHSIFALPFAYIGIFLAADGWPGIKPFFLLTVAMVAVRSFAMAFNRLVDINIDSENPRTRTRPLVTGELSTFFTFCFIAVCAVIFVVACKNMNELCYKLSYFALGWSAFYSITKRFTKLCHFVLGSVLGLAPLAGWLCVDPHFTLPAILFFFGVVFWVAGFDILYATQDRKFDKGRGLFSIPASLGINKSLTISTFCHVNTGIFFLLAGLSAGLGWIYFTTTAIIAAILVYEHQVISADDMSRVNMAFFALNGVISVLLFAGTLLDILI